MVSTVPNLDPTPPPTMITVGNEFIFETTEDEDATETILTLTGVGPMTSEGNTNAPAQGSSLVTGISALILAVIITVSVVVLLMLFVAVTTIVIVKKKRRKMKGFENVVDSGAAFSNQVYMNRDAGE